MGAEDPFTEVNWGGILEIPPMCRIRAHFRGQWLRGSLTGAVTSQRVPEVCKGRLRFRPESIRVYACLTVRGTPRAETQVGPRDPVVPSGRAIAQRIKGTPGITG